MTQEEKAKRFDEALAMAKECITYVPDDAVNKYMLNMFPELKESKDEKIRKCVKYAIDKLFLKEKIVCDVHKNDVLAWLEKQSYTKKDIDDAYLKGVTDAKNEMEKQYETNYQIRKDIATFIFNYRGDIKDRAKWMDYLGIKVSFAEKQSEQNHCMIQWKGDNLKEVIDFTGKDKNFEKWFKSFEEYEKYVLEHNNIFKLFNADGSHYEVPVGAWIVKTPDGYNVASKAVFKQKFVDTPKFKVEQTTAWSEDDKDLMYNTLSNLTELKDRYGDGYGNVGKCIDWLKSLKDRVQPQQEWNEEDDQYLLVCKNALRKYQITDKWDAEIISHWLENKLKAHQTSWKPSLSQLNALSVVSKGNAPDDIEAVVSLYNDLKKLRED